MKLRTTLLAATALALASSASAATGWYMSLGAGANWLNDADYNVGPGGSTYSGRNEYESGYIITGAVGYDWGRWRGDSRTDGAVSIGPSPGAIGRGLAPSPATARAAWLLAPRA